MLGRVPSRVLEAVVFDLDGVLVDSEQLWDSVRRAVVTRLGGRWREGATAAMQGMSSPEWSAYMRDELDVDLPPEEIAAVVVDDLLTRYSAGVPFLPGALDAVRRVSAVWPLALASSANRVVIDTVLRAGRLSELFAATVSSEEVARGKPAPDVYLEAARRLGTAPQRTAAVEDSANGILAALGAGMVVVAVPNPHFPPPPGVLGRASAVLHAIGDLRPATFEALAAGPPGAAGARSEDDIDEEEIESFPASDPHADWAGPTRPSPRQPRAPRAP